MVERIKKYERCKDYWAWKCIEVKLSLISTIIFSFLFLVFFDFYNLFSEFQDSLQQILLTVIGGEFGLLGMSLAGMAIITSLFSQDMINIINKVDNDDVINRLLSQFEFSAFNLGIQIIVFVFLYFTISSSKNVIDEYAFSILFVILIYHFFFNLFYIIALIGNCIKVNTIKDMCNKITVIDKSQTDIANEIRIDYILAILLKERGINRGQLIEGLSDMIDRSNIKDKQQIKDYLKSYYSDK